MTPATSTTLDHAGQATSPSGLSGYAYLSLGVYDNKPINWIIIGYNTSSTTATVTYNGAMNLLWSEYLANSSKLSASSFAQVLIDETTDAGLAINSASSNGKIYTSVLSFALDYSSAVNAATKGLTELSSGELLVISQGKIGSSLFGSSGNVYSSSSLLTAMRNLYYPSTSKNGANFTASEAALIVPKTLTTAGSSSLTEYLFPLAARSGESFLIGTYLTSNAKCSIGINYWLRSGNASYSSEAYRVIDSGSVVARTDVWHSCGVRPAMVIKI